MECTSKACAAEALLPHSGKMTMKKEKYFKRSLHAPTHLFLNDYCYFVTAGCYHKKSYIDSDDKKEFLYETIWEKLNRYFAELHGWVVLDNHYHILLKLKDAFLLPKLIQAVHAKSAISINRMDKENGRKVWYNYWDECIRDERDFYTKLNYIHLNPIMLR